jgi:hypothetical protein
MPGVYGIWLVLIRPAMAFGEGYEFLEVVLSFARPQEPECSREVHVSHQHLLHGWRHEAARNEGQAYSGGDESQCPIELGGFIYNSYLNAVRDKRIARVFEPIAACPDDERFVVKIGKRHAFLAYEAMIHWNGQHIGLLEENPTRKFGGAIIEDREYSINLPFSEPFDQLLAGRIAHLDIDLGVCAPERTQQLGNVAAGEGLQYSYSQKLRPSDRFEFAFRRITNLQDRLACFEQTLPSFSGDHWGAPPV